MTAAGSGLMTTEQKRMEEAAKRAAQRAVNQLRMSRHTLRAGAGQVTLVETVGAGFMASNMLSYILVICSAVSHELFDFENWSTLSLLSFV